jgi:hypothetical protein
LIEEIIVEVNPVGDTEEIEAVEIEAVVDLIDHLEKCIKQFVLIVEMIAKYHLYQLKENPFTAEIASRNVDLIRNRYFVN